MALAHLSNDTVRFTNFFVYNGDYICVSEFNLFKCSHFLNSFELLENRKKTTLIFTVVVFTISCKTKTIVVNVNKRTVTASGSQRQYGTVCHLMAVYDATLTSRLRGELGRVTKLVVVLLV